MKDKLPDNIRQWYQDWFLIDRVYTRWARQYDLTYASLFTLYVLYTHPGCTASYIAEFLSLSRQTVAATLQRFEERGLTEAVPNEEDRRCQIVIFTAPGRAFADKVLGTLYAMEKRAFSHLTDEEIAEMVRINRKLADAVQAELEEGIYVPER